MNDDRDYVDFTIVSVAFGSDYKKYVDGWWASINLLEKRPKEIIIVHNPGDDTGVRNLKVTLIEDRSSDLTSMLNIGIRCASTRWIGVLSLDDRYLPDALNDIDDAGSFDIIAINGISMKTSKFLRSSFDRITTMKNTMLGSSFFTKELYLRVGGWPNLRWSDWGFWWLSSVSGARACNPLRTHIVIDDVSDERYSSGDSKSADKEMTKFMKRFW